MTPNEVDMVDKLYQEYKKAQKAYICQLSMLKEN